MTKPEEIAPSAYYSNLQTRRFVVRRGWDNFTADRLVLQSREDEIAERYPRDYDKRFSSREVANRWFEKDESMAMYTLALGRTADLAGVIWVAHPEEKLLGAEKAFNMRIYASARGRELAVDFGQAALIDYELLHKDYEGDIGVNVNRDYRNEIQVYGDLGFSVKEKPRVNEFITMLRPGFRTRVSNIK